MNKATVESMNLVYVEKLKKYAAVMVVDVEEDKKYILLEDDGSKFYPMKKAQEIAAIIDVPYIDETKADIQIGFHELEANTLHDLKYGERLTIADFTIERSHNPDLFYYRYPSSSPSPSMPAKYIAEKVKTLIDEMALQ